MERLRLPILALLACAASACNQGDSGNVMASGANALTPAQVDAVLGPELSNEAVNAQESPETANAVEEDVPAAAQPAARRAATPPEPAETDEPEDHEAHDMPAEQSNLAQ